MSNPPSIPTSSKAAAPSGQLSPAQAQPGSVATGDNHGQRRSGGFGAAAAARSSPAPRNNQQSKKQHRNARRPQQSNEDAIAESLAMRPFNSRKGQTSITHLMNFSLPPRPHHGHNSHAHARGYRRNPTWGLGSGYHAIDKARYVHANYRFIVDPRGDYGAQGVDADIHLDWNSVLQIIASSQSQDASCPICLGTPVAPRMARCGHIFCLPCLIRYMHSEDEGKPPEKRARSKKCPLCWDTIFISETRPVRWYVGQEGEPPREGGDVVLRLVMRSAGSTLAMPRDGADALSNEEDIPWYHAAEVMDYARVMRGGEDYMAEQFDRETQQLLQQEQEDELMFGEDNKEWFKKALRSIQDAKEKAKGIGNPPEPAKPAEPKPKKTPIIYHDESESPEMYLIQSAAKSGQSLPSSSHTPAPEASTDQQQDAPSTSSRKLSVSSQASRTSHGAIGSTLAEIRNRQQHDHNHTPSEYFFYQALLHYYLSPLDIRILKSAFGSFASFPSTILPRVERVSTGHVVDDDLRKRTKYLAHLPYGCEVSFLECDWTDTVAPEVLERFKPEIERRRKRHLDKETKEEKARVRAEKAEYAEFASARRKRSSISDKFSADDFQPLASSSFPEASSAVDMEGTSSSPPWPARRGEGFASLASPSTSPSQPRTVWGTAAVAGTSPNLLPQHHDGPSVDDGWLQGWEKDLLQEEELIAQAQAMSLGEEEAPKKQGGGKKKKGKKITLMSTNVRRGA
ncbi:RING finger domain-containing protein [Corynespora cassiicola Philippines]|uniref:RING finger domain-containing protein n=1 Tax=Corynespora cassiicola Philippines TaxID=1448308 RepID=A0A2T2NYK8_CORCC|nr:RING finger domain-containing protein [Corynespora cassiicola Philippines]